MTRIYLAIIASLLLITTPHAHATNAREQNVLIYGDSLSAGYGLAQGEGFAPQLERALKRKKIAVRFFNASQTGETTAGGLSRLAWTLDNLPKIDMVVLSLGANDMLRAYRPRETKKNVDKMLRLLKERNIKVLLTGMVASLNLGETYRKTFGDIYPTLAKRYNVTLYPFFLEGVAGKQALNLKDGIHPNRKGIKVMVSKILPFVVKVLEQDKP